MTAHSFFLKDTEDSLATAEKLGQTLKAALENNKFKLPFLITLSGELGAGKTTFCQGLSKGLGVFPTEEIQSPTFTLANEYAGAHPIYHLDVYRLEPYEFFEAGLDEYLLRPGFSLVEWPERMSMATWPKKRLELFFTFHSSGGRFLEIKSPLPELLDILAICH